MGVLRDAHPWLREHDRQAEAGAVENVLQYRLDSAPAGYRVAVDLENIEELFSLSDTGGDILSRDIRIAIAATLDYRLTTVPEPTTSFSVEKIEVVPPSWNSWTTDSINYKVPTYSFFVQSLLGQWTDPLATSAFITFNYDCLLKEALASLGRSADHGLPKSVHNTFSGPTSESTSVRVLKLHGSVNWLRQRRSGSLQVETDYPHVMQRGGIPEIVAPTWRKLFSKELVAIWKTALEEIESATRIIVMGFSMPETDLHFKYLLASGLRRNIALREIVFVDPAKDAVHRRAEQLFGDLDKRPSARIVPRRITEFVNGGCQETVDSIGRRIPRDFGRIQHSVM